MSRVGWGEHLGWTEQELHPAETSLPWGCTSHVHGICDVESHLLTQPAVTWHIHGSLCGGEATWSLGCGEEGAAV